MGRNRIRVLGALTQLPQTKKKKRRINHRTPCTLSEREPAMSLVTEKLPCIHQQIGVLADTLRISSR
ncbi:hypothetical protein COCSUDRAFT_36283 [Coccomyxa subellipsoidea C-169]|uniref:Uncharacterized protein n=1 Tax=Coccomyxa subellipsoidea (strain C-169) TaxID=574566 RepID=I0Z0F5_COCSC|nr:hypothetical protein COCSUDRAFT_36283 [Coccomyxa subellipsoidea C-169]EIE24124.1 hypothetical protein COCSUDRAFT_36283 [Coccomyxa subellipsoidea C-169]|eukprot:XP_005648668.1 hypothetical protein COCSUDRAFT_36283 [Coccomyxa subellipsoidea C-169]